MLPLLASDAATDAMGVYGAYANLTCLAFVLLICGYEVIVAKPRREKIQRESEAANQQAQHTHLERLAAEFRAETREQRQLQMELVAALRADNASQRADATRIAEKHAEAITGLTTAVHSLRQDLLLHASRQTNDPRGTGLRDRQTQAGDRSPVQDH